MIDLHLHTTASDGALAPSELVNKARAAGLSIISITDHDTTAGVDAARAAAQVAGIELIPGVEVTAVDGGRDTHILGYFIDTTSEDLRAFLERQRADRLRRLTEMRDRLAALGCPIDTREILEAARRGQSVGRPQIANALLAAGHAQTRDEAFDRFLSASGPAHVPRTGAPAAAVVKLIHDAGGLASLAHPGPSGRDDLIPALTANGLDALEARHIDHDAANEARYRRLAAELG
ncbi:MAG TPA: PHP domain-containing protein, partial [Vicinamibacterales bacterium]|nr:PHP domain-containing protein [Vicinamibacterales bacterium]